MAGDGTGHHIGAPVPETNPQKGSQGAGPGHQEDGWRGPCVLSILQSPGKETTGLSVSFR